MKIKCNVYLIENHPNVIAYHYTKMWKIHVKRSEDRKHIHNWQFVYKVSLIQNRHWIVYYYLCWKRETEYNKELFITSEGILHKLFWWKATNKIGRNITSNLVYCMFNYSSKNINNETVIRQKAMYYNVVYGSEACTICFMMKHSCRELNGL